MALMSVACAQRPGPDAAVQRCIDRSSDGPWSPVGAVAPKRKQLAKVFSADGEDGLRVLLGTPNRESALEAVWVFEERREYTRESCAPPAVLRQYDQVFNVVRTVRSPEGSACTVETREFIQESVLTPADALDMPPPLWSPPRQCGSDGN